MRVSDTMNEIDDIDYIVADGPECQASLIWSQCLHGSWEFCFDNNRVKTSDGNWNRRLFFIGSDVGWTVFVLLRSQIRHKSKLARTESWSEIFGSRSESSKFFDWFISSMINGSVTDLSSTILGESTASGEPMWLFVAKMDVREKTSVVRTYLDGINIAVGPTN